MAFDILDSNLEPNQPWWTKISDIVSQMRIELFNSQSDRDAGINRVAFADVAFGSSVNVSLTADSTAPAYGEPLAKLNAILSYHLIATGADGDLEKKLVFGPYTYIKAIEDPLMLTENMIRDRATVEINKGTHATLVRSFGLDSHYPALNEGEILTLSSSKRGLLAIRNRIDRLTIEATIDDKKEMRLIDTIECVEFKDVRR